MKLAFPNVVFTDESRVTKDGPDGWGRSWVIDVQQPPEIVRRQQGGGRTMIWAGIVDNHLIGLFKVGKGLR